MSGDAPPPGGLDPQPPTKGDSLGAAFLVVGACVLATVVVPLFFGWELVLLGVGPAQLIWGVPMAVYAKVGKRPRLFKVTLIVAGVIFLLNVTCTAIVLSTVRFGG